MKTFGLSCIVFAGITLFAPQALFATEKDELETLQKEVDQLKKQFESQTTPSISQSSFNPAVSLILMGRYAAFDNDPVDYAIPGVSLAEETDPGPEGFSIGESELVISASVDNMFLGRFTTALTPGNEVEIEEALVQTLALPVGLTMQFGRFYSDIGYLNSKHVHQWDFVDQPLVYRAYLGNQYNDDGLLVSTLFDLPAGSAIVWCLALLGLVIHPLLVKFQMRQIPEIQGGR